jgi:predicted nucleic acid-binding protein
VRVVVDTNVLISAGLKADSPPRLALRWLQSRARLLKSADTEEELRRTMRSAKLAPLLARGAYVEALLRLIEDAEPVVITAPVQA